MKLKYLPFLIVILLASLTTSAQTTYTFNGGIFVSPWDDPATWTPNGVPGPSDTAVINILPGTNSALMFHDAFEVGTLRIRSYFDLLGSGKLTVLDSFYSSYPGYCFINFSLAAGAQGRVDDSDYAGPGAFHVFNNVFAVDGAIVLNAAQVSVVEGRVNGTILMKKGRLLGHQIINPDGQLIFDPLAGDTLAIGRITNRGKVVWKNGHLRNLKRRFVNEGLWLMEATGHTILNDSTHIDSLFVNTGILYASSVSMHTHLVNSGTIDVAENAVLSLEDGMHFYEGILSGGVLRLRGDTSTAFGSVASTDLNVFDVDHTVLNVFEPFNPADTLRVQDAAVIGQGSLTVTGHLDWRGGTIHVPVHVFADATALIRTGQLESRAGASFFNEGETTQNGAFFSDNDCINTGVWAIANGQPAVVVGNGSFQNYGSVSLCGDASGSLTVNVPMTNHNSGRLEGKGGISFGSLNNFGLTAPGCTVGTLTIAENFDTGAGVTIDVEGDILGQFDRLVVFGDVNASGTLQIETPPGFILSDTIDVIFTTGAFIGVFDNVVAPPNYKVLYRPNGVSIVYSTIVGTVTAEPASPWQLSPTLATDEVRLASATTSTEDQTVWVMNAQGRIVQVFSLNKGAQELTIPVSDLPAGLYFVQVVNGNKIENFKFVKI
ncbi:MAG: T9SS type A sorting domain-containing protein [Saprospiraceae bacterium]|nr:T9SS type A sorting domain-containing protein [Saprospiraceae bacterium]